MRGTQSQTLSSLMGVIGAGEEIGAISAHTGKNANDVMKTMAEASRLKGVTDTESAFTIGNLSETKGKDKILQAFIAEGVNAGIQNVGKALGSIGAKQTEGNEGFYTENSETKGLSVIPHLFFSFYSYYYY